MYIVHVGVGVKYPLDWDNVSPFVSVHTIPLPDFLQCAPVVHVTSAEFY